VARRRQNDPQRRWFQDKDGTYYRNGPLILAEEREWLKLLCTRRVSRELDKLHAEFQIVWKDGLIRKPALEPGDRLVQQATFRDAYPDKPGLWVLDGD
jgi:hypothetical protein